jgi:hypothetical protein
MLTVVALHVGRGQASRSKLATGADQERFPGTTTTTHQATGKPDGGSRILSGPVMVLQLSDYIAVQL